MGAEQAVEVLTGGRKRLRGKQAHREGAEEALAEAEQRACAVGDAPDDGMGFMDEIFADEKGSQK